MTEKKKQPPQSGKETTKQSQTKSSTGSVYADKKKKTFNKKRREMNTRDGRQEEYEQRIIDIARVTRVMAGGKRMRFRACVAIGDKKGKIGVGLAKGADVTMAVTKAVNKAKKKMIDAPIVNETIPHEIYCKKGAAKIILKPARKGKGVIAGGAVRIILELSGIKNITSKNLGTNNKINIAECTIKALDSIKKVAPQEPKKKAEKASLAFGEPKRTKPGDEDIKDKKEKDNKKISNA